MTDFSKLPPDEQEREIDADARRFVEELHERWPIPRDRSPPTGLRAIGVAFTVLMVVATMVFLWAALRAAHAGTAWDCPEAQYWVRDDAATPECFAPVTPHNVRRHVEPGTVPPKPAAPSPHKEDA